MTAPDSSEPLPCRTCGKVPRVNELIPNGGSLYDPDCNTGSIGANRAEAIARWNKRNGETK